MRTVHYAGVLGMGVGALLVTAVCVAGPRENSSAPPTDATTRPATRPSGEDTPATQPAGPMRLPRPQVSNMPTRIEPGELGEDPAVPAPATQPAEDRRLPRRTISEPLPPQPAE